MISLPHFGPHTFLRRTRGGGASYDADAETLFAAMTSEPDATRKQLISDTIAALKAAGIWDELDECWFLAAHAEQAGLLGWKRLKDCTAVNAPTFTTDRGFAGNGTTSYLNTQFVPSTDGVQYTLDDASLGVYSRTDLGAANNASIGAKAGVTSNIAQISPRNGSNSFAGAINQNSFTTVANTDSLGLFVVRRTASNAINFWKNGASLTTGTTASSALPAVPFYIGAANVNGSAGEFTVRQHAYARVGGALTTQQLADEFTIVEAFLDALGAGVVA